MKKIFVLLILLASALILVGCKEANNEEIIERDVVLEKFELSSTLSTQTTVNYFPLITTLGNGDNYLGNEIVYDIIYSAPLIDGTAQEFTSISLNDFVTTSGSDVAIHPLGSFQLYPSIQFENYFLERISSYIIDEEDLYRVTLKLTISDLDVDSYKLLLVSLNIGTVTSFVTAEGVSDTVEFNVVNFNASVTFDTDGGTLVDSQIIASTQGKVSMPSIPTKEGYVFGGWYDNETFTGNQYNFSLIVEDDLILYAKWNKIYYLTFESNGGTEIPQQSGTAPFYWSIPEEPTKDNYIFNNWYIDEALTIEYDYETPFTEDTTLYAKWIPIDFNVYVFASAYVINQPYYLAPTVSYLGTIPEYNTSSDMWEDYTLEGIWDNPKFEGDPYDWNTPVTGDVNLYWKWTDTREDGIYYFSYTTQTWVLST